MRQVFISCPTNYCLHAPRYPVLSLAIINRYKSSLSCKFISWRSLKMVLMAQCDKTLAGTRNSPKGGTFRIARSRPFLHRVSRYWCHRDGRPRTESGHRLGHAKCTSSLGSCYEEILVPLLPSLGTCSQGLLTLPLASMLGATFRPALGPSWDGIVNTL